MADPQDQPNSEADGAPTPSGPPGPPDPAPPGPPDPAPPGPPDPAPPGPPEKTPPAKAVKKTAKAPAKKAPAKKAPAKKAPAKKAAAKKAPAKSPEPPPQNPTERPAGQPLGIAQRIETNGQLAAAAKDVAAQAKSTVEGANNPVLPAVPTSSPGQSPVPLIIALTLSLLAILLIRQLRRR
jgi:hypothetical protein